MNSDTAVRLEKNDLLDRYDFASDIVKSLLVSYKSGQASMVIGINGEWGCGKSSLLEFIKSEILIQTKEDPYRNIIYDFNPWRIEDEDQLLNSFLKDLGQRLGNYNNEYEKLKSDFNKIADEVDRINVVNPDINSKLALKSINSLIKLLKNPISISQLKSEADERLSDNNIKLFIFIDDLDRCTPKEITRIFQIIKLNADFKNTFFFVAYDKEVVISALKKEYGNNGEKYLEKIVQVDYLVPKILPEKLKSLFGENFNNLNQKFKLNIELTDFYDIWESGLKNFITTLRHIYRLINSLELRVSKIIEDVYPLDFMILETIRIFEYQVYEWIYKNRENLIYKPTPLFPNPEMNNAVFPTKAEFILKHSELIKAKTETKELVVSLFNFDDSEENRGILFKQKNNPDLDLNKRIASERYFDHYFSFKISSQNLSSKELETFIKSDSKIQQEILDTYLNNNIFDKFLEQLRSKFSKISFDSKISIINVLLDFSDDKKLEANLVGYFRSNGLELILSTFKDIGKTIVNPIDQETLLSSLLKSNKISYSRLLILEQLFLRIKNGKIYPETDFFNEKVIRDKVENVSSKVKDQVKSIAMTMFTNLSNFDAGLISYVLTRLNEFFPEDYNLNISKAVEDPNNLIILLQCSLTQVTRSGFDKPGYNLTEKHQLPGFSTDRFDNLVSRIDPSVLNENNKKLFNLFLKLKENNFNTDQFFTMDLDYWTL